MTVLRGCLPRTRVCRLVALLSTGGLGAVGGGVIFWGELFSR